MTRAAGGRHAPSPHRGVYPGSFDPLTTAHLAVAETARRAHRLAEVHLAVSRVALDKERASTPLFEHRVAVLEEAVAARPWLGLVVTDAQLVADIAEGYAVVVMGADKWEQIHDPRFYGSVRARDEAVARLPTPAIAPRPPHRAPRAALLDLPDDVAAVSSTRAREGGRGLMAPEAAAFDRTTGAWTDPERYRRWIDRPGNRPGGPAVSPR